jgi:DNA mismatch endonuclease (patch repair protein)
LPREITYPLAVRGAWADVAEDRRLAMRANRRRDTGPEIRLRSELYRRGLRYRVDHPVRIPGRRLIRPDIVFLRKRIAVFVDGCFWHSCPEHGTVPARNNGYWAPKLKANAERDIRTTRGLEQAGWTVIRIWEHESVAAAADVVAAAVAQVVQAQSSSSRDVGHGMP